ncbi:MAG: hypothetical protein FJX92_02565 [Bacteroidetes bacterium]|nr:hypothetical protein [Bacteroidota bacterium]
MQSIIILSTFSLLCWLPLRGLGQAGKRDTTGTVDIISNFKPTLRDLVKMQFTASTPPADTSRQRLTYQIPSQELSIVYQPGTLKPLAYQADSNLGFRPTQYLQAGYGSLSNPYLALALELGKKSPVRIYGGHQSATGQLPFQGHSISHGLVSWQLANRNKGEWISSLSYNRQRFNKYGFDNRLTTPPTDSIRQVFHQIGIQLGYRKKELISPGFFLEPIIDAKRTTDQLGNQDLEVRLSVPSRYKINDRLSLLANGLAHLGRIKPANGSGLNHSVYSLQTSLHLRWPVWSAQIGIRPSWDASGTRIYPDLQIQWHRPTQPWLLRAQWTGELQRTGYRDLFSQNPWLWMPSEWRNQGRIDRSISWQYNRRAHWVYELRAGYQTLQDAFLFINDTTSTGDGKSFQVVYADRIQNLYLTGKLSYRQSENWLIRAEVKWNNYHGLRGVDKAWGFLPFEWNLHGWHRFANKLRIQADLYSWFAPHYLEKTGKAGRADGAIDLNLGAQMPITRSISGWLQCNNVFNRTYSRWSQYPTYGFHIVGGVVFSLDKKMF